MGKGRGRMGEMEQGIRIIFDGYRTDRGVLEIVWEVVKTKNSYVQPTDMN